jgi:hypothetical protein
LSFAKSKLEEKKQLYFNLSENSEKKANELILLEKKYEEGKIQLKDLQRESRLFADTKINLEHSKEQYKHCVVVLWFPKC